jgi:hypothetical protein
MVHRAEHEPGFAQPAEQRDPDVRRVHQPAGHLRHQWQVEEVIGRVDHHDLGRDADQPGQVPRGVEAGETRPDDHHSAFLLMAIRHLGSSTGQARGSIGCLFSGAT